MAIAETDLGRESTEAIGLLLRNPYALEVASEEVMLATAQLVANEEPYIDSSNHPDIARSNDGTQLFSVYRVDADHPAAVIARAMEGTVIRSDWDEDPSITQEEAADHEDNSTFFIVVDMINPDVPRPAATLRIADMVRGGSETVQYFHAVNGEDAVLPPELKVSEEDRQRGLWDVVSVMAPKEYRNGWASVWAYHGLYKSSQEQDVHRWISNIAEKELGNLHALGIPFTRIPGTVDAHLERKDRKPITFGFHTIDVDAIPASMTEQIGGLVELAADDESWMTIANLASIAMSGKLVDSQ